METAGLLIIGAGALGSLAVAAHDRHCGFRSQRIVYDTFRATFGRGILLGREFPIGTDIIRTGAVTPTLQSATILALIILIRLFLSVSLEAEIEEG